jgi:asparagine synthase (glutamine-hydrolysing)
VTPGEYRVYDAAGLRTRGHYWSLADSLQPSEARSDDEHLDELQARIDRATQLTLQSDVPVGLFLSGGVDSSLVAESAARLGRLEAAFCVDFADQGFSEWPTAAKTAHRLGVELVRVPLDVAVLGEFLDVVEHLDDPLADSSALAVWTVARAAAARLKVVLSGDGGDELFGGYLTYPASKWHARLRRFTPRFVADAIASAAEGMPVATTSVKVGASYKLRRFLRALPLETREAHFTWNATWLPSEAARLAAAGPGRLAAADALARIAGRYQLGPEPTIQELQCVDACEYLPHDILAKVDRSTMAHGLESRTPFLNADVASYALALPERLRVKGTTGKVLLRQLCARHFGAEHAYAPKQGFSLPIHQWLRGDGRALMSSLLARDRVAALGVLDADEVARVVDRHLSGARAYGWELWGLMVLVAWHERRVMSPPDLARLPDPTDMRQVVAMPLAAA